MIDGNEVKQGLFPSFLDDFPSNRILLWAGIQKARCLSLIPLELRKAGRVWCGGARETH